MINSLIFVCAILSALVADSSPVWCAIFALVAASGFALQKLTEVIRREVLVAEAKKKSTGSSASETDAWVRHIDASDRFLPSKDITIWEEFQ